MLSQNERSLLIKTYEKTYNAGLTAGIFGATGSAVYVRLKAYRENRTPHIKLIGGKSYV